MCLCFFLCQEQTGRLNYVFCFNTTPVDFFRVAACGNADFFAIDDQEALLHIVVNSAFETTVHCVVFQHVSHVVNGKKVVDSYYFDVVSFG